MTAAALVRESRKRHGLNQASLARRCRTSQTHISRIERGAVSPSIETLEKILHTMGERLELRATPGPRGNESDADIRAELGTAPAEHLLQAAELSFAVTTIAGSQSE